MSVSTLLGLGAQRHPTTGRGQIILQPRASQVFQPGAAIVRRIGSMLAEVPLSTAPRADYVSLGTFVGNGQFTASSTADSSGGSLDSTGAAESITVTPFSGAGTGWFATGSGVNAVVAASANLFS